MPSADWDFESTDWTLDSSKYVSSPSSLHQTKTAWLVALCKKTGTTALSDGRVILQSYIDTTGGSTRILFRNQKAVGGADNDDSYSINMAQTSWELEYIVGGSWSIVASSAYYTGKTVPINTWNKLRVTWWSDGGDLFVRVEKWDGSQWVQLSDDLSDSADAYAGNAVNRVGHRIYDYAWVDDVEIYG